MTVVHRIVRALARMLVATGGFFFLLGALVTFQAIRHNMQWKPVEASVICVNGSSANEKVCCLKYVVNGKPFAREYFRSDSAVEGLIGKQKLYYWKDAPAETSLHRDCGLGLYMGNTTALLGLVTALPGTLILRFWRPSRLS